MKRISFRGLVLCCLLTFMLVACATAPPATEAPEPTEVMEATEEPPALSTEPVTLTFWWEGAAVGNLEIFQKSFDKFQEMHPNVTIEVVAIPFEDMLRTFPLALDAGTGPDISMSLPLESTTFPAALAGHLLDLGPIGAERGWWDQYDTKALDVNNRGLGGTFGVPYEWTVVGVYYNKGIFNDLGLQPPTSFEEFEGQLETILAAGITPISVGGKDGWPLDHVWQQMVHTNVDYSVLRALEDRDPNASYEHPALIETAVKVLDWKRLGFLDPNLLSTGFTDANDLFISGQVAMNVGGTWVQNDFRSAPFEVGFFAMPRMRTDIDAHLGGFTPANDIVIVKDGENQDWALELLGYLLSEENMTMWWQSGILVPYRFDPLPQGKDQLQADIYQTMQENGPGHFITVSAPETSRILWANLQEIVGETKTPEQAFAEIQETYLVEVK
ncbi:MAG: extracellular solute-binding protein [Anaerolineae bacterium]|nr:extracellular solute-binding protein [Anaerolineae bacterium]